ncbi:amp dependent CoA ligase [Fistulina hepatica ATCC 64428]|uniref:Amp dependent CoA ligase n=1 Tax=Fistulina hepatica ATCC 64428 TaxID=1128425 RepID=A0A0D7AKC8_9AGAR|nr:amp dependent CoA ligase [Fistulina hepatica ATCC 64428]
MSDFRGPRELRVSIPDNLTIPQFVFDYTSFLRPQRPTNVPWLIQDHTGKQVFTEEIRHRTQNLTKWLNANWKLRENDVVALYSPNDTDYPLCIWAVHKLGGILTPANPSYTVQELIHQLEASKATALIAHSVSLDVALSAAKAVGIPHSRIIYLAPSAASKRQHPGLLSIEDVVSLGRAEKVGFLERRLLPGEAKTKIAFLSFSSGTTGTPKGVMISHYSVIANVLQMADHQQLDDPHIRVMGPGEVCAAVLPFFHIYGLIVIMHFCLFAGNALVVFPKFNFVEFLKSIERYKISIIVPPQVVLLCKHPDSKNHDLRSVKFIMCGAAPLSHELTYEIWKVFPTATIGQGFGMTETATTVAMLSPTVKRATVGSAGYLVPGIRAKVAKPDGSLCKEGEVGELVVTGPSMALGYLNNEKATKETFADGWVRTGDQVYIKDHQVFIVDRIKELIKVRGFQVAPAELEGHLHSHPAVNDVCVIGIPDDYNGELPMAFVVLKASHAERAAGSPEKTAQLKAELIKFVADNKVYYKHLKRGVEFLDAIPKNPSGKMLRRVLRDSAIEKMKKESSAAVAKL